MPHALYNPNEKEVLNHVLQGENFEQGRWNAIDATRDLRYGRDDVISSIPEELRATDFEYHSPALDEGILNLSAFLSAATMTPSVDPPGDKDRIKADDLEALLKAVFGPNGKLETEAGGEVSFSVWQNQVEHGEGIYKFFMKKDYPLGFPSREFIDEMREGFEDNPDFNPKSRKATRAERGLSRFRESNDTLDSRREKFQEEEFPWMWVSVDRRTFFMVKQGEVVIIAGEITARPASVLNEHGFPELMDKSNDFVYLGEAYAQIPSPSSMGNRPIVNTFEAWTPVAGYFGFIAHDRREGKPTIVFSKHEDEKMRQWSHPYGRPPYYYANGLPTTDNDRAFRWAGAFGPMIMELPLLNNLESMHYNSVFRGHVPLYYPVMDPAFAASTPPLDNMEQLIGVQHSDTERTQLPPGWKWEVMPSGFEPDLMAQLLAARERVEKSAIAAVLTGTSPGAGDSGAKISLLINAAARALSPFIRHHEAPLTEMQEQFLTTNKRFGLDISVSAERTRDDGTVFVTPLSIRAEDIVSTSVRVRLEMALPVDQAAMEVRALTLIEAKVRSYETIAPQMLGVGDPTKERHRIAIEGRERQIDDIAFENAAQRWQEQEPSEFAEYMGNVQEVPGAAPEVGGGPEGAFGGAAALMGRGGASTPSAPQVDGSRG